MLGLDVPLVTVLTAIHSALTTRRSTRRSSGPRSGPKRCRSTSIFHPYLRG